MVMKPVVFIPSKILKAQESKANQPSYAILLGEPKSVFQSNKRLIDGQLDRNRIWQLDGTHEDHALSRQVIERLINYPLVCAIDIHMSKSHIFAVLNSWIKKHLGWRHFLMQMLCF